MSTNIEKIEALLLKMSERTDRLEVENEKRAEENERDRKKGKKIYQ